MSCNDATNQATEYMRARINPKYAGQACLVDLKKAYVTLDHEIW